MLSRRFPKIANYLKLQSLKYRKSAFMKVSLVFISFIGPLTFYKYVTSPDADKRNILSFLYIAYFADAAEIFANTPIPPFMRQFVYKMYAQKYNVDLSQIQKPLQEYKNFSDFFTRKILERPETKQQIQNVFSIVSPCDGQILNISPINSNKNIIVKDISYSLSKLVLDSQQANDAWLSKIKKNADNDLYQVIIYLHPGNYHRFHSPYNMKPILAKIIQGKYRPVNLNSIIQNGGIIYEQNARKIIHALYTTPDLVVPVVEVVEKYVPVKGRKNIKQKKVQQVLSQKIVKGQQRYMCLTFIGALNVKNIIFTNQQQSWKKGSEIGYFNLGSTIVMLLQLKKDQTFSKKPGEKVKFGQKLCQIN